MYKHVLVPVDPSHGEVGPRIVEVARLLAGPDGRITLLTVIEPVPSYVANYIPRETTEKAHDAARASLEALARDTGLGAAAAVMRSGSAVHVIIEEAERLGCDAIVLGSHRPDYRDYLIGSTAARVVRHAQCTVVVERSSQIRL